MFQLFKKIVLMVFALSFIAGVSACGPKAEGGSRSAVERPDDMALGNVDAAVTLIEYASFTCPHCSKFQATVFPEIKARYIDTGKIRFIFRQFPTPPARLAVGGEAMARCKGGTDAYFVMLNLLFEKQQFWLRSQNPGQALRDIGAMAGLTPAQFDTCVSDKQNIDRIQEVGVHAQETWGIGFAPQFVINGVLAKKTDTIEDFAAIIDPILTAQQPQ